LCFKGFKHAKLLVHGLPLGKDPRDLRDGLYIWFATEGVSFAALWKNGGVARTRWQGLGKLRLQGSPAIVPGNTPWRLAQTRTLAPYWFVDAKMGAKRCEFGT